MDHMRISGNELSTLILSKTKWFQKFENDSSKVSKQAEAIWDGLINLQNYNFNQF